MIKLQKNNTINKISEIDRLAYNSYIELVNNPNLFVCDDFVDNINVFINWHNRNNRNLELYYDKAKTEIITQRKEKLKKLKYE